MRVLLVGNITTDLPEFLARLSQFERVTLPTFKGFAQLKPQLIAAERERLKLSELQAKTLAGFVRNRLIDKVYLPLIGNSREVLRRNAGALVSAMHHKMTLDHSIWEHVRQVRTDLDELVKRGKARGPGF